MPYITLAVPPRRLELTRRGGLRLARPRTAKQVFVSLFGALPPLLMLHALRRAAAARRGQRLAWLLAAWAHAVPAAYFGRGYLARVARTSPSLAGMQAASIAPAALLLPRHRRHPLAFALAGAEALATLAYVHWYSRLDREPSAALAVGAQLPADLPFVEDGRPITAAGLRGRPTVYLFYRGNWCPLCMAQIGEIADRWRQVEEIGAQVALVSPQDEAQTRRLAARHKVAFRYLRDERLEAARRLGIVHANGTPAGMPGYDADTVLPTVVVTDGDGRIAYADQTDYYRVRPTPEAVLAALRDAGLGGPSQAHADPEAARPERRPAPPPAA